MNVKAERESLDMTQKEFANVLGVPREPWGVGDRAKYAIAHG